ncbi:Zinc finger protein sens [Gryllus bimaculatus]|nr:Zinc finger protein sens [Gryllus bimaculatus]
MANMINTDENFCLYMDDIVKTEETVKDEPMGQMEDDFENAIWNCLENTNGCSEDDILKAVCRSPLMVMLPAFVEGEGGPPESLSALEEQDLFAVVEGECAGASTVPPLIKKEVPAEVRQPVHEQTHRFDPDDRGSPKVFMEVGRIEPPSTTTVVQMPVPAPAAEGGGGGEGNNIDRVSEPPVLHVALRTSGADKAFQCSCGKVYRHSGSLSKHIRVLRNRLSTQPNQSGCGNVGKVNTAVNEKARENNATNANVNCNTTDMQPRELSVSASQKEDSSGQNFVLNTGCFQGGNNNIINNNGNTSPSMQSNVTVGHCNSLAPFPLPSQVQVNRTANTNVQCNIMDMQQSQLEVAIPQVKKENDCGQNYALNSIGFQGNNKIAENRNANVQSNKAVGLCNSLSAIPPSSQVQTLRTTNMTVQSNMTEMQHGQLKAAISPLSNASSGQNFALGARGFQESINSINNGNLSPNVQNIKTMDHGRFFEAVQPTSNFSSILSSVPLSNSPEQNGMRNVESNMNASQYNSLTTTQYAIQANPGPVTQTSAAGSNSAEQNELRNTNHNGIDRQYSSLAANPHVSHYSSGHMSTPIPAVRVTNNTGQNGLRNASTIGGNSTDRHYTSLATVPHVSQVSNGHGALTAVQDNVGQNVGRNPNVDCNLIVGQYYSVAAVPQVNQISPNRFNVSDNISSGQNRMSDSSVENNMPANQYSVIPTPTPTVNQTVSGGYSSAPANAVLINYSTGQNGIGNAYVESNLADRLYSPHVGSLPVSQASSGHVNTLISGGQRSSSTAHNGMRNTNSERNMTDRQYTMLETVPHASQASSGLINALATAVRDSNSCVQNGTRLSNMESNMSGRHYTTLLTVPPMNQASTEHVSTVVNSVQGSISSGQDGTRNSNIGSNATHKHYTMLESVPHMSQDNSGYVSALTTHVQNSSTTNQNRIRITSVESNMTVNQYNSQTGTPLVSQINKALASVMQNSNRAGNEMKNVSAEVSVNNWQQQANTVVTGKCDNPIDRAGARAGPLRPSTKIAANNQVVKNAGCNFKLSSNKVPSSLEACSKDTDPYRSKFSKLPASEGSGYNCFCGVSFQNLTTLLTHVENHSKEEFELYSTQAILHIKDPAPKDNTNFCSDLSNKCNTCGIWFEDNVQLNLHMESHVKVDCNEQTILNIEEDNFISSSNNDRDNNERTYQCAICDKIYKEFTDLMMHMEIHQKSVTDEQETGICKGWNDARNRCVRETPEPQEMLNYQCGLCKKRFKKLRYLTSHMRCHTKTTCPGKTKKFQEPLVHGRINSSACDVSISNDPAKRMKITQVPLTQQKKSVNNITSSSGNSIPLTSLDHLQQNNMHLVNSKNTINTKRPFISTKPNHQYKKTVLTMERGTSTHPDTCSTTGGPMSIRVQAALTDISQEANRRTNENHEDIGSPPTATSVTKAATLSGESKTFSCICGMVFRTSCALAAHTTDHIGRREYFCDICGKLFRQKCILLSHLRYHSYQKAYKCCKCSRSFERHSDFMAHKRLYRVNASCYVCRKKVTRAVCGANHTLPFQNKTFLCVDCNGSTVPDNPDETRDKLGRFTRKHGSSSGGVGGEIGDKGESEATKSVLSCTICKSVFTDSKSLLIHSHSHLGECAVLLERLNTAEIYKRSYNCGRNEGTVKVASSHPPKASAAGIQISNRLSKAVGKKRFTWKCRCGGVFKWRSSMKKHLCKYTGHQCVVCRRLFRRFASLRDHMRSHTGRRKYKCTTCTESFSRLRDLEVHQHCHAEKAPMGNVEACKANSQIEPDEAEKGSEELGEPQENHGSSEVNSLEKENPGNTNLLQPPGPNPISLLGNEGPNCTTFPENCIQNGAIHGLVEQSTLPACSPSDVGRDRALDCETKEDCGAKRLEIQSHKECNLEKTISGNVNPQLCCRQQLTSSEGASPGEDKLKGVKPEPSFLLEFDKQLNELQLALSTEDSNSKTGSIEGTREVLGCGITPARCHSAPVEYLNLQVKQEHSMDSNKNFQLNPHKKESQFGSEQSNDGQSTTLQVGLDSEGECVESKFDPKTMSSDLKSNGSDRIKKELTLAQPSEKSFSTVESGGGSASRPEVDRMAVNCGVNSLQNYCSQETVKQDAEQTNKDKDLLSINDRVVKKENLFQVCKREPDAQPPGESEKEDDKTLGALELQQICPSKKTALVDLVSDDEDQHTTSGSHLHPCKKHCSEKLRSDLCEHTSKMPSSSPKVYQICDSDVEEESVSHPCPQSKSESDDVMLVEETSKKKKPPPEVYEISDSDEEEGKEGQNLVHDDHKPSLDAETSSFACDVCMKPFPDSDALQVHKHIWGKVPCNINKWRTTTQNKPKSEKGAETIGSAGRVKRESMMGEESRPSSAPESTQTSGENLRECPCSEKTQCCCKSKCQRQEHRDKATGVHVCRACGKSFAQKDFLIDHLHEHIDGRKYRCKYCSKTFQRSVKLAVHKLRCSQRKMSAKKVKPASDDDDVETNKGTSFPRSFAVPFVGVQPQTVPMLVSVPVLVSSAMTWGNIVTLR